MMKQNTIHSTHKRETEKNCSS